MTAIERNTAVASSSRKWVAVAASLGALIAACGGAGAATSQMSSSAPASATTSSIATTSSSTVAAPSSAAASPGQAAFILGAAATKVGMANGDASDPNGGRFLPAAVSVHVGDIVEWDYDPAAFEVHNIVFPDAPSLSNRKGLGAKPDAVGTPGDGTWQVRFTVAGQYNYVCTFHPGMTGTVTVR